MADKLTTNDDKGGADVADAGERTTGGPIVVEASWAPADPRDRLYDSTATPGERTASLVRILAAFHPVLNSFVLSYDLFRRLGVWWSCLVLLVVAAGLWWLFSL